MQHFGVGFLEKARRGPHGEFLGSQPTAKPTGPEAGWGSEGLASPQA